MGNTAAVEVDHQSNAVHPHARGEHEQRDAALRVRLGSSPRPWGTLGRSLPGLASNRFIPTPVGNTSCSRNSERKCPVHPHARGEHLRSTTGRSVAGGSSPRPWGTRLWTGIERHTGRFIPTPVGNTGRGEGDSVGQAVHPHARGEHDGNNLLNAAAFGSSPRPWGTQQPACETAGVRRFIPTPVGNTTTSGTFNVNIAVHPHARGEHAGVDAENALRAGSSPRPWGTPNTGTSRRINYRFIPTPVGNTPILTR